MEKDLQDTDIELDLRYLPDLMKEDDSLVGSTAPRITRQHQLSSPIQHHLILDNQPNQQGVTCILPPTGLLPKINLFKGLKCRTKKREKKKRDQMRPSQPMQ